MSQVTTTQNHKVLGNKKLVGLVYSCPFFFPPKICSEKKESIDRNYLLYIWNLVLWTTT